MSVSVSCNFLYVNGIVITVYIDRKIYMNCYNNIMKVKTKIRHIRYL